MLCHHHQPSAAAAAARAFLFASSQLKKKQQLQTTLKLYQVIPTVLCLHIDLRSRKQGELSRGRLSSGTYGVITQSGIQQGLNKKEDAALLLILLWI